MPEFVPLQRMWARAEQDKEESDYAYVTSLLYMGEMQAKLVTAGMVAAIRDDKDRHRYSHVHALLRADGIGEWAQILDTILHGPTAQFLDDGARQEQRELTQKCGRDTWQYDAAAFMYECCRHVQISIEPLPAKVSLTRALHLFAQLRNKTRGHGAPSHSMLRQLCDPLTNAIRLLCANFFLFQREWVYLHRNLSGKYRVTRLSATSERFEHLKKLTSETVHNGVYISFDQIRHAELALSDSDLSDFFLPNGHFTDKRHEWLSYITGATIARDSAPYLAPPGTLPESETGGTRELDVLGRCFTNPPRAPSDFIRRDELEEELHSLLLDQRHEIVTLIGRGGIGKTSLALKVLHDLSSDNRYDLIVWFSARDIDLTPGGPKQVRPRALDVKDLALQYASLVSSTTMPEPTSFFARELSCSDIGRGLFGFDNFETVTSPVAVYNWIDTHIRPPNKALITTRYREFRGDYPIEIRGMKNSAIYSLTRQPADWAFASWFLGNVANNFLRRQAAILT
jgi:hypothetical protein